jgi:hypothetical protein
MNPWFLNLILSEMTSLTNNLESSGLAEPPMVGRVGNA